MEILKINNISFSYDKKNILEDISFSVDEGEIFCIVGPNGCGKSTLLDCIIGVNKINSGSIILQNLDINKYKYSEIAKYISYVPQSHVKSFPYSVKDIVLMGRTHSFGFASKPTVEDKEEVINALKKVGIEELKDRAYTSLSGGELQLVMISRALYQNSKIIVMDEPTAHLDFFYENKVLKIISNLVKEDNISVIMATHFLNHPFYFENEKIKTTVGIMNDKRMLFKGRASETMTKEKLNQVYNLNVNISQFEYKGKTYKQVVTL